MKYYIIAGEASGDLHGSNLIKALLKRDKQADIRFWGGDLMQKQGGVLVKHYKDLAFMGFIEVLFNLRTILNNIALCKKDILDFRPDIILYIDYPGFNLRIAQWAKKQGFTNHYYISPQIWAWKENRIHKIKASIDKLYVILPFEKDFYEQKHNFPVHYVGHPLLDAVSGFTDRNYDKFYDTYSLDQRPIIALLPGSRKQEISRMLPVMLQLVNRFKEYQFVVAAAPSLPKSYYDTFISEFPSDVKLVINQTYQLLNYSHAALVTSGTATLETALFKVPQVVCYKAHPISYLIAKQFVKLEYISLVNLILNRSVVTELIQDQFTVSSLANALQLILHEKRSQIFCDYYDLEQLLGETSASENVADKIVEQ